MKRVLGVPAYLLLAVVVVIATVAAAVMYKVQAPSNAGYYSGKTRYGELVTDQNKLPSSISYLVQYSEFSSISCLIPYSVFPLGNTLVVSGMILPTPSLSDGEVTLTYTQPDDTVLNRTVPIGPDGGYGDSYAPGVVGVWSVTALWSGDALLEGAISTTRTFTVTAATTGIPLEFIALGMLCAAIIFVLYKRTH